MALVGSAVLGGACSRPGSQGDAGPASSSAPSSSGAKAIASDNARFEAEAGAAQSLLPGWVAYAERAPVIGAEARKERQAARLKHPRLVSIDNLFDSMVKEPETADGLIEAARLLEEGRPLGADREWTGSGTSPGARLLHHGGVALLVDLGQRACSARAGDKKIGAAADTVPLPPVFGSGGGVDKSVAERDRHLLQEATRACGSHP